MILFYYAEVIKIIVIQSHLRPKTPTNFVAEVAEVVEVAVAAVVVDIEHIVQLYKLARLVAAAVVVGARAKILIN